MAGEPRSCGPCRACCFTHGVSELSKSERQACPHVLAGGPHGCGIYETRPASCRRFECAWLEGHFEDGDRPDRLGVVLDFFRGTLVAIEAVPGGLGSPRAVALLEGHEGEVNLTHLDGRRYTWPRRHPRPGEERPDP